MASIIKKCDCTAPTKCQHPWTIRYRDAAGKQREETRTTNRTEAKQRAVQLTNITLEGGYAKTTTIKFGEYARQVIATRDGTMSPNTRRRYLGVLDNHLNGLASMKLADVAKDRDGVTRFLTIDLPAKGLSRATIEVIYAIITSTLNEAVRSTKIDRHNIGSIKLPPVMKEASFEVPTKDEVEKLAENMGDLGLAVWLAYGCGLRLSEALGVKGSDFRDGTLTLARQVTSTTSTGPLKARKPGETRDIPVPSYIGKMITTDGFLFQSEGRFISETHFNLMWRNARDSVKPGFRFHDLRHTYASYLLANGIDLPSVSRWLGHRDVSITARVYAHSLPKTSDKARELLDQMWAA